VTPINPLLLTILYRGDASVIHTALELDHPQVLIDERSARRIAREVFGLKVIGTTKVLVEANHASLIENVQHALLTIKQSGYWIDDRIIPAALLAAGEA